MATLGDNILLRDLDDLAKTRSENADKAKAAYIATLNDAATSTELRDILKQDYTLCADLARALVENAMLAKRWIVDCWTTPTRPP